MITKAQIRRYESDDDAIELPNGWTARVMVESDSGMRPPWESEDRHGPVSEWTKRRDRAPGERVLIEDGAYCRYYDFAEARKAAQRDGWGCPHGMTRGDQHTARCAAEQDFQRLRAWCNDEWEYVCVSVELRDAEGEIVEGASDSLCGVESDGDYWKEVAAEMINGLAEGLVMPSTAANGTDGGRS
jgi:hypothetical protein